MESNGGKGLSKMEIVSARFSSQPSSHLSNVSVWQASTLTTGPAGVFHSGGQSGQWTKESAGPKGPAIISSDHKVFVLHWPEV